MGIRVLHLVYWLNRGGIENWLLDLLKATDRQEIAMDFCCRGPHTGVLAPQFLELGAKVHSVPLGWNPRSFGRRLKDLLREGEYQVLNIHAGSFAGYPCDVAHQSGVASVVTFHSTSFPIEVGGMAKLAGRLRALYTRRSFRSACRLADSILSCSRTVEDAVVQIAGVRPDERFEVIFNGTGKPPGRNRLNRESARGELGIPPDTPTAIHVGSFRDPKNHAGLVRIAAGICRELPEFQLLMIGEGPLRPGIEQMIRELHLEKNITLLGLRGDVERLLDAADLMIFPSLWEGLPVAVIEAQIKGLVVVGSNIGPMREATRHGETSLLFPVEREDEMASAAVGLLRNAAQREQMSRAAVQFAMENFSIEANAKSYHRVYRQALARRATASSS